MTHRFPDDFLWGAATAAFQIEGATREDGRGESIWDRFSHQPGKTFQNHNGDLACDHYHRVEQDLDLLVSLGLPAYRFSVSWPRVYPQGDGPLNPAGLEFYRRLVAQLKARGIRPAVTLNHWDLPQALQDRGGWTNRQTMEAFRRYARTVFEALGDDVALWITHNEPWVISILGNAEGVFAPGLRDMQAALSVAHHLLVSHGLAVREFRSLGLKGKIGITLNMTQMRPASDSAADRAAADRAHEAYNAWFSEPVMKGQYPAGLSAWFRERGLYPPVQPGDFELMATPTDFLGLNHYTSALVRHDPARWPLETSDVVTEVPQTEMGWAIDGPAFFDLLTWLGSRYPGTPIYVTENGAAFNDLQGPDGSVDDGNRVLFLQEYLGALHRAIAAGVPVKGYFLWSLLDNFEWALGYSKRFGIVHVDYATQRRTPKRSALWYRDVIKAGGF